MSQSKLKEALKSFHHHKFRESLSEVKVPGHMRTLRLIDEKGGLSQVQAAKLLGMTTPAALSHFRKLIDENLVGSSEPEKTSNSRPGRPATQWHINAQDNYTIGMVFEPPLFMMALADFSNTIVHRMEYDTSNVTDTHEILAQIDVFLGQVEKILPKGAVIRSGCACLPGPVNIPYFKPQLLRQHFMEHYRFEFILTLLTAASSFGVAADFPEGTTVAVIGWDLGVSVVPCWKNQALFFEQDGEFLHGITNFHYKARGLHDMGHMVVEKNGRICRCGKRGCLEAYAGGSAIIKKLHRPDIRTLPQLLEAAMKNDPQVLEELSEAAHIMGEFLSWVIPFMGVDRVVFSGPMSKVFKHLRQPFCQGLAKLMTEEDIALVNPVANPDPLATMILGACRAARHFFFNADLSQHLLMSLV